MCHNAELRDAGNSCFGDITHLHDRTTTKVSGERQNLTPATPNPLTERHQNLQR